MAQGFVRTYLKQILLVLTPIVFCPLLFIKEETVLNDDDYMAIYGASKEKEWSEGEEPCLFKVSSVNLINPVFYG